MYFHISHDEKSNKYNQSTSNIKDRFFIFNKAFADLKTQKDKLK